MLVVRESNHMPQVNLRNGNALRAVVFMSDLKVRPPEEECSLRSRPLCLG